MSKVQLYISTYLPYADRVEKEYGIPALFLLAQSAFESGYGNAKPGNMMFGVKAGKTWTGRKQLLTTTEYTTNLDVAKKSYPQILEVTKVSDTKWKLKVKDWFRAYDTPYDSFVDHAKLITKSERYKGWERYKNDISGMAYHLASKGYATLDPIQYRNRVASIANEIKIELEKKK